MQVCGVYAGSGRNERSCTGWWGGERRKPNCPSVSVPALFLSKIPKAKRWLYAVGMVVGCCRAQSQKWWWRQSNSIMAQKNNEKCYTGTGICLLVGKVRGLAGVHNATLSEEKWKVYLGAGHWWKVAGRRLRSTGCRQPGGCHGRRLACGEPPMSHHWWQAGMGRQSAVAGASQTQKQVGDPRRPDH